MYKRFCLLTLIGLLTGMSAFAQVDAQVETTATVGDGDHSPLWLNANKYGLSSVERNSAFLIGAVRRRMDADSARRWAWQGGLDMALAANFTSTVVVHQAYGELRWLKGLLTVGSKEQPMELKNQELSSGSQTFGINARPVPSVRLSLPNYWEVPFAKGWLGVKGHIAYGMQTDDSWQKDFTHKQSKYAEHTRLHTKAGYLHLGKADKPLTVEVGIEMACQYGGTSYRPIIGGLQKFENKGGMKGMWDALIPSGGGEVSDINYHNSTGNHLGSYVARINLDYEQWGVSVYADHFFEDQSSMFFLDYDGYGTGERWNVKEDSRYFRYDLHDIMLGTELRLKDCSWLNALVVEYLYTKYQSGPIYHDHTQSISDHIGGVDDYYNHGLLAGWQHWGQVMGNPLYRSPLYNTDATVNCDDNRFWAWHFGVSGSPCQGLHYRVLASLQKGWGTYMKPLVKPAQNFSVMAEADYHFADNSTLKGWGVKGAIGMDRGELLGNNLGMQMTISKKLNLEKR